MADPRLNGKAPAIRTHQLTKFYGPSRGVIDLDLEVNEGEVFGFLGPNGAGKSTTIRLLMDLIRPTRGSASIFGLDTRADSVAIKALTGYLPGELSLWPNLTGWQTLTYLGNLRGGVEAGRIEELAARLELDLTKKFREYSHGNKQKVGLVQAFMHRPRLLILDEPTSGLDPLNQQEFFRMAGEARDQGSTVFLSSHVLSEVEYICDRVGLIREGRMVRVGTVSEVLAERQQRVEMTLDVPTDKAMLEAFDALPGVEGVEAKDHTLTFMVKGSLDPAIKLAARYPITGLITHEPTLEEAFLAYYLPSTEGQPEERAVTSEGTGSD